MNARPPVILDQLASLADSTRSRILLLLDGQELSVSELCNVLQLPQSTVSRHLKALSDAGWVSGRAEGTSNVYAMSREARQPSSHRLWSLVREQVGASPAAMQDQRRLQAAMASRRSRSVEFFTSSAGQWDRMRDEMFGNRFHLAALAALLDADATMGDLGCGTGQVSEAIAPFVARVIGVDSSAPMLQAAQSRLQNQTNVELRRGELEALPIDDNLLDVATVMLVLHHVPEPARALAEVARVLKPGGRLVLVDMLPHDRENYRQQMGHVWLGFSGEHVERLLADAGFERRRLVPLPADPKVKGPALFAATGTKIRHHEGTKDTKAHEALPQ
jgi:ubiquinone/menaquinone biosynthesis C-methylase UbiE